MIGEGDDAVALATYQYAANNGKLLSMTYGNGKIMTYTYDELDRVKEICYTDSSMSSCIDWVTQALAK